MGLQYQSEESANPTTPASGQAVIYPKTDHFFYWKDSTGQVWVIMRAAAALTSGRIPYATTSGSLLDSAKLGFDGTTMTVNAPLDISGATGGQIVFPATQNASAGANTLDDYEEGTWTPGFAFGGGATGVTYNAQVGRYTKIGNRVITTAFISLTSKGSSTGNATITGLPFTANSTANNYVPPSIRISTMNSMAGHLQGYVTYNTAIVSLDQLNTGTVTSLTDTNFNNTSDCMFSLTYEV